MLTNLEYPKLAAENEKSGGIFVEILTNKTANILLYKNKECQSGNAAQYTTFSFTA